MEENNERQIPKYSEEEVQKIKNSIELKTVLKVSLMFLIIIFLFTILVTYYFFISDAYMPKEVRKLLNIVDLYEENYYEDVDLVDLIDGASRGLVEGSGDKYGAYLSSKSARTSGKKLESGHYFGLGITYTKYPEEGYIEITDIVRNGPADRAGLKIGSIITHINDKEITEELLEQFSDDIQGKVIRDFVFTFEDGTTLTVTTDEVDVPKVDYEIIDNVGYISIYTFVEDTVGLYKEAFDNVLKFDVKEIVIDLRDNTGGDVDAVVEMLDYIIGEELIVKLDYKNSEDEEKYSDSETAYDGKIPISIIVNEHTASASELMTMVLQDVYDCKVYGKKTFGKSTILSVYSFKDGSMFVMSVGLYLPPSGRVIEEMGIEPDVEVSDEDIELSGSEIYYKYINNNNR